MAGEKQTKRLCERDGFPLVKINGRWECVAEYLDRCVGGERIDNVIQRDGTFYYIFESGHELPLLCFCCGKPLVLKNTRQDHGRRLESMSVGLVSLKDGSEMLQFRLELSKKGIGSSGIAVPISVQSAARMRHPPGCPHTTSVQERSTGHSKRRRRRRRP